MTNENIQTALYVGTLSLGFIGHLIEVKRLKSDIKKLKKDVAHYKEGVTFWGKKCDQLQNTMGARINKTFGVIQDGMVKQPPTTPTLSFPCCHCDHQFGSQKALDAHVSQKHDPFGFTCVCGRFFTSKQGLGRHLIACKAHKDQ